MERPRRRWPASKLLSDATKPTWQDVPLAERAISQIAMRCVSLAQASNADYGAAMNETVRILLPVSPEAAAVLGDEDRLQQVGQFVSALVLRTPPLGLDAAADTFMGVLLDTRTAAAASGLTDADVDAELAAWKLERAARRR